MRESDGFGLTGPYALGVWFPEPLDIFVRKIFIKFRWNQAIPP